MWRTLRPSAGQAQQWVSEWVSITTLTRDWPIGILSVRPSVRLSCSGTVLKRLNISSCFLQHMVSLASQYKRPVQNSDGVTFMGPLNTGGYINFEIFDQCGYMWKMIRWHGYSYYETVTENHMLYIEPTVTSLMTSSDLYFLCAAYARSVSDS